MSKTLIIVESPTKAKTIQKFLGKEFEILSSFGHIRDLPKKNLGVDVSHEFTPTYEIPEKSKKHALELKRASKNASSIYLATDEDREGEAIAWHIANLLSLPLEASNRITFHEITHTAIEDALKHPRALDLRLINAQQARRILDRLVGYELSPFLWKKIQRGLSAGRVQSVAVRLIVERERERLAFQKQEYWTIEAEFEKDKIVFPGKLIMVCGKKIEKMSIENESQATQIMQNLSNSSFVVKTIEQKQTTKTPLPPFTTSTLQIEANTKLGYSAKQTMMLAQKLYETGRITYMRTDSVNLSEKFLTETQAYIKYMFGSSYATGVKKYQTKSKGAQEAHEAIHPTDVKTTAQELPKNIGDQMRRLYDLIWRRAVACQLPAAKLLRTSVDLESDEYIFRASGHLIEFDGFMKVYQNTQEKILPALAANDKVQTNQILPHQHFTEPPARYSDATLVKTLEEHGIGRPSTYAPTISTIIERGYVDRDEHRKLFPYDIANIVTDVLVEHFPKVVDYQFTAKMETELDEIAEGSLSLVPMLSSFYEPFHETIKEKETNLKREDILRERLIGTDPSTGLPVIVRNGRFGPFVQLGQWSEEDKKKKINRPKSASLEKGQSLDTITLEEALHLLILPRTIGCTQDGETIVADHGRFGPYLRVNDFNVSLPNTSDPRTISLEQAQILIKEYKERKQQAQTPLADLGTDSVSGNSLLVKQGRFGPYVTNGKINASVPKSIDPLSLTLEQGLELLLKKSAKKKYGRNNQDIRRS